MQPSAEKINLTLAVLCERTVDTGHCLRYNNKYYRMLDNRCMQVHYRKGTKTMFIQAFDGSQYYIPCGYIGQSPMPPEGLVVLLLRGYFPDFLVDLLFAKYPGRICHLIPLYIWVIPLFRQIELLQTSDISIFFGGNREKARQHTAAPLSKNRYSVLNRSTKVAFSTDRLTCS